VASRPEIKPRVALGSYAAKRQAAIDRARQLREDAAGGAAAHADLGTPAPRRADAAALVDDAERLRASEEARAAWLRRKRQDEQSKREREQQDARLRGEEQRQWQAQRATAGGTRRPPSAGSLGRLASVSLPIIPSATDAPNTAPLDRLRQRRKSRGKVGAAADAGGCAMKPRKALATRKPQAKVGADDDAGGGAAKTRKSPSAKKSQADAEEELAPAVDRAKALAQSDMMARLLKQNAEDKRALEELTREACEMREAREALAASKASTPSADGVSTR
jgi:hypothetical protein